MRVPRIDAVSHVVDVLQGHGLVPALGGSGLLVALGLAEVANDWDLTVDGSDAAVVAAVDATGVGYRDGAERGGVYATGQRYVLDGGDHDVDLLVRFALQGPSGVERLPTRVTGQWRGLPLGDPAVWMRAYQLLDRPTKADALSRVLRRDSCRYPAE